MEDAETRVAELEAENARLREALDVARVAMRATDQLVAWALDHLSTIDE